MIKQILSIEIKEYIKKNPNCVLLDVRTKEEWNSDGKPDGEKFGLKTYFLSLFFNGRILNENFVEEFKNLNINQDFQILSLCASGHRSKIATELLTKEGYSCLNISDGLLGDGSEKIGWKNNQLPMK